MRLKRLIWNGLLIAAICLAFWLLYRILHQYSFDDIRNSLLNILLRRLGCLHELLSAFADGAFFRSVTAYVLANTAVLATQVPGGLGILETTVAYSVPDAASIGALIAFRCIYFLIPLVLGTTLLITSELAFRHRSARTKNAEKVTDQTTRTQSS